MTKDIFERAGLLNPLRSHAPLTFASPPPSYKHAAANVVPSHPSLRPHRSDPATSRSPRPKASVMLGKQTLPSFRPSEISPIAEEFTAKDRRDRAVARQRSQSHCSLLSDGQHSAIFPALAYAAMEASAGIPPRPLPEPPQDLPSQLPLTGKQCSQCVPVTRVCDDFHDQEQTIFEPSWQPPKPTELVNQSTPSRRLRLIPTSTTAQSGGYPGGSKEVVILNTTPDEEDYNHSPTHGRVRIMDDGGVGPSLKKVSRIVRKLFDDDRRGKIKLRRIREVVIEGAWVEASGYLRQSHVPSTSADVDRGPYENPSQMTLKEKRKVSDLRSKAQSPSPKSSEEQQIQMSSSAHTLAKLTHEERSSHHSQDPRKAEDIAIGFISIILLKMSNLEELWNTALPFTKDLWNSIPERTLGSLSIDLFKPHKRVERTQAVQGTELQGLRKLTQLRRLTLIGMLESCQKEIWEAAWMLPRLKYLELGMAIGPDMNAIRVEWPAIEGDWQMSDAHEVTSSYHGDGGQGILHANIGCGEYLDPLAILRAKKATRSNAARLSIEELVLAGFVVDALAFERYFDPQRLRVIDLARDCVDAGLTLREEMRHRVKVGCPRQSGMGEVMLGKVCQGSDIHIVTVRGGNRLRRGEKDP
ncbi:MAG: hypothetical protein M1833_003819 [Piccolia ochrophora]|nr:MAG: hypothetical protein M1833_003819 [Piccolia ochrophora]